MKIGTVQRTLVLSLSTGLLACGAPADEAGPAAAPAPSAQTVARREASLGLARMDNRDGTYSFKLRQAAPARRQIGGLSYRYDGQARFEHVPTRAEEQMVRIGGARPAAAGPHGAIAGTVSVDAEGRRWVVDAVDGGALDAAIARYDALVLATVGEEPGPRAGASRPDAEEGQTVRWRPLSWNRTDCSGDGDDDRFTWDADDRAVVDNPMIDRQRKVLLLRSPAGTCSATMVDTEWLLTAAHCVTNGSGTAYNPSTIDACTRGNYQAGAACFGADIVTVAAGWGGSGMSDDYAVVHLTGLPGVGWMAISSASDGTISGSPGRNIGYPGYRPSCASNSTAAINAGFPAKIGYWSSGDVTSLSAERIKTNIDVSTGHSGGPFFYCPSGCSPGASHFLTGVATGHIQGLFDSYNGGPKGPAIRAWVIANTP